MFGRPATLAHNAAALEPPSWEEDDAEATFLDQAGHAGDLHLQPEPEYEFDRRLNC